MVLHLDLIASSPIHFFYNAFSTTIDLLLTRSHQQAPNNHTTHRTPWVNHGAGSRSSTRRVRFVFLDLPLFFFGIFFFGGLLLRGLLLRDLLLRDLFFRDLPYSEPWLPHEHHRFGDGRIQLWRKWAELCHFLKFVDSLYSVHACQGLPTRELLQMP